MRQKTLAERAMRALKKKHCFPGGLPLAYYQFWTTSRFQGMEDLQLNVIQ